ncbi:MAG: 4-hydroxy-tetrahydrodipicolinate synthase [Phycisphaerae bacterium]
MTPSRDKTSLFRGTYTALVTPFRDGMVDWPTLDGLVDRQIQAGVEGVVPCGSTGESATLTHEEHDRVIEAVMARVAGRCKVLAGTGSNSTREALRLTRHAADLGVDGALIVTPYYNRPMQEGLFRHFSEVAGAVDLPIVLYNVPVRCGVDLLNETVERLRAKHDNIVAIKDASGGVDRVAELVTDTGFDVLCGDDVLTLPMMAHGAVGVISVISNLVPQWMKGLVDSLSADDLAEARVIHHRVRGLAEAIGRLGPNPIPIKTAMALQGLIADEYRLPLCPLEPADRRVIEVALQRYELLQSQSV